MANILDQDAGSELFASYEAELRLVQADLSQKLESLPELTGEPRKAALAGAERVLDEAREILDQMRVEKQSVPTPAKQATNARFRNASTDVDELGRRLSALRKGGAGGFGNRYRDAEGGAEEDVDPQLAQRQQLLSGTDRLERSSGRLRDSQRVALETEEIGQNTLADLGRQRETIQRTRDTLLESEGYTDRSIKTLRGMARRMATNRLISIAIITVLVLLIIAVVVSKFR